MDEVIVKAGVRFNPSIYVSFILDPNSGDMGVFVELGTGDEKRIASGTVQWEEGE